MWLQAAPAVTNAPSMATKAADPSVRPNMLRSLNFPERYSVVLVYILCGFNLCDELGIAINLPVHCAVAREGTTCSAVDSCEAASR